MRRRESKANTGGETPPGRCLEIPPPLPDRLQRYSSAESPPRFAVSSTSVNTGEPPRCLWIVTNLGDILAAILRDVVSMKRGSVRAAISRASFTRSLIGPYVTLRP